MNQSNQLPGLRVLIVEDEPLLAMCLGEVIQDYGCVVVGTAGSVSAALDLVASSEFDVAVLDLNLHGEAVNPVAAAVTQRGRALVFSTGSGAGGVPVEFQDWPVLAKPYRDMAVAEALRAAVEGRVSIVLQRDADHEQRRAS